MPGNVIEKPLTEKSEHATCPKKTQSVWGHTIYGYCHEHETLYWGLLQ